MQLSGPRVSTQRAEGLAQVAHRHQGVEVLVAEEAALGLQHPLLEPPGAGEVTEGEKHRRQVVHGEKSVGMLAALETSSSLQHSLLELPGASEIAQVVENRG